MPDGKESVVVHGSWGAGPSLDLILLDLLSLDLVLLDLVLLDCR